MHFNRLEKVVGILGGMGPYATADIFLKILQATPAEKDWEHLRIIVDNNPKIPSRTRAVILGEESPLPAMIETARNLENAGADLIIIPCNSAHFYMDDLRRNIDVPILSIIEITAKHIAKEFPKFDKVGILGGLVTMRKRLYDHELKKYEISTVVPEEKDQDTIVNVIENLKLGKKDQELIRDVTNVSKKLIGQGAKCIVLACTELSILFNGKPIGIPVIDSNKLLAEETVKIAKETLSLG